MLLLLATLATAADFSDWNRAVEVSVTNPTDQTLDVFPVMVKLDSSRIDYTMAAADGSDLRFADAADNELPYEIELWDPAGTSVLWVRATSLPASSSTTLWLYYDNPLASAPTYIDSPWDNGYAAVWHLTDLTDSVGGPDAVAHGAATADGLAGGAYDFDGQDDYIDTLFDTDVPDVTVMAWGHSPSAPDTSGNAGLLMREENYQLNWNHTATTYAGAASLKAPSWNPASFGTVPADDWVMLALTYDGDVLVSYLDGQPVTMNAATDGDPESTSYTAKIGRHAFAETVGSNFFEGRVDEVRIVADARSQQWMAAENASVTDALASWCVDAVHDADGDGDECDVDCHDNDIDIGPTAAEVACNGLDDDCNPATSDFVDDDTDGVCNGDDLCDGHDDGVDSDGDGNPDGCDACPDLADEVDGDGDGFYACDDCDDSQASIYPGAPEIGSDGIDQDCDGQDRELAPPDTGDTGEPGDTGSDTDEPTDTADTGEVWDVDAPRSNGRALAEAAPPEVGNQTWGTGCGCSNTGGPARGLLLVPLLLVLRRRQDPA